MILRRILPLSFQRGHTFAYNFRSGLLTTRKASSAGHEFANLINVIQQAEESSFDWNDRAGLQYMWTKEEKGWTVEVEYKPTPYGIGVFAAEDIDKDTVLRAGLNGKNLLEFQSADDILAFCRKKNTLSEDDAEYQARLAYATDYLWGFSLKTDNYGFALPTPPGESAEDSRFYGMWVPGNGLNHCESANTVYRARPGGTDEGINLIALEDIPAGQELTDDYRRHSNAPLWLAEFSKTQNMTLNFADCNDFV